MADQTTFHFTITRTTKKVNDDTIDDTPARPGAEPRLTEAELTAYWNAQMNVVQSLRRIGVNYDLRDRIEPMKAYRLLRKLERRVDLKEDKQAQELIEAAKQGLEGLVYLRTLGYEPDNKGNRYV